MCSRGTKTVKINKLNNSGENNTTRPFNLKCEQQQEGFHTVEPPVDKVTEEEVVSLGHIAADLQIESHE